MFLTDSLHHAGLSGVGLHRDDVLEAVQRDDALARPPHLEDVLHLGAQSLPHRAEKTQQLGDVPRGVRSSGGGGGATVLTLEVFSPRWYSRASYRWL